MQEPPRRAFTKSMLRSLLGFSLVKSLCARQLLAGPVRTAARELLIEMQEVSRALKEGELAPVGWQRRIEASLARVELSDLLRAIDYRRMVKKAIFPDDHESAAPVDFSRVAGLPAELSFEPYFYALARGRAIVPHGHRNMTSMHMVLHGRAHSWHYDRVADEPGHLIIRPTGDAVCARGAVSTISDRKDNIHWFKALTETVFMFNIGVFGVDPSESFTGRDYIDPAHGERMKDGLIRARRLEFAEARKLYGKS